MTLLSRPTIHSMKNAAPVEIAAKKRVLGTFYRPADFDELPEEIMKYWRGEAE